jgi:hypothetical protein
MGRCLGARLGRVVAGDDHSRHVRIGLLQRAQHVQAADVRHAQVEQHALRALLLQRAQELGARRMHLHREAGGTQQATERLAHRLLIIDDRDAGSGQQHGAAC